MRKVLIIVDMQVDFITGKYKLDGSEKIVEAVANRATELSNSGYEVIVTRDISGDGYINEMVDKQMPTPHCLYDSNGWKIIPELNDIPFLKIDKTTLSYDNWEALIGKQDNLKIELIGVCTDIEIISNALVLKTYYPEADISVNSKCCAGTTTKRHAESLDIMKTCGINVI